MNGERTFGQAMPHGKLSAFMNTLFNVWFKKWWNAMDSDANFDAAMMELWEIIRQGDQYPLVSHLGISFLYELDAIRNGGYTETTRDNLLSLIDHEGKDTGVHFVD